MGIREKISFSLNLFIFDYGCVYHIYNEIPEKNVCILISHSTINIQNVKVIKSWTWDYINQLKGLEYSELIMLS